LLELWSGFYDLRLIPGVGGGRGSYPYDRQEHRDEEDEKEDR
jgi:hypothetical protein